MNKLINKNAKGIFNVTSDNAFSKYKFGYLILKKKLNFKYLKKSKISDRKDLEET